MYFLYRWWDRYRIVLSLILLTLGGAWSIRETEGAALMELYRWLSLPFQADVDRQEQIINAQNWELRQRLAELELQNQTLQKLLEQPIVKQGIATTAPIIGRSADHWWQQITLGRGRQAGLKPGAVVVAPGGLVGRITSSSSHTSRVLLITDPTSRIGVTVGKKHQMGILRGQAKDQAIIEFFDKSPDVRPGDVVMTSALSSLFPAGLPIGQVKSLAFSRTSPQAIVELSAPLGDLEWVTVYRNDQTSQALVSPSP